jgi:branched-chain amino acid transport system permease protein
MNVINLAHGALYMIGAYVCAWAYGVTGYFLVAIACALLATLLVGLVIEIGVVRSLYQRNHGDQVLATFALTLFFNALMKTIWGPAAIYAGVPEFLSGRIEILPGVPYPAYRFAVIVVGVAVALLLYFIIMKTRIGMLIRAGASNRTMVGALGVNVPLLYTIVFCMGALLAALSGLLAGPIYAVESGMGDNVVILAFVVIIIGGIGSIRGAFIAAVLIGLCDTMGRAFLKPVLASLMGTPAADNAGPALASMLIYILMALVLFFRPQGLFPPRSR